MKVISMRAAGATGAPQARPANNEFGRLVSTRKRAQRTSAGARAGRIVWLVLGLSGCGGAQSSATHPLLAQGVDAPDFMASDQTGEVRRFAALRGDHAAVLFFYPRDGTPGCTAEACAFRDSWDRLQAAGAVVVGVSTDSSEAHAHFAQEHQLQFSLLADPDGRVTALYGVPEQMGMATRVTFLVDRQGHIARVFPHVDPAVHVDEVITAIGELPAE